MSTVYPHGRKRHNMKIPNECGAKVVNEHIVIDDRIISGDGPGSSLEVAFFLMNCLIGSEMTQADTDSA
jgi:hypothetical protein